MVVLGRGRSGFKPTPTPQPAVTAPTLWIIARACYRIKGVVQGRGRGSVTRVGDGSTTVRILQ